MSGLYEGLLEEVQFWQSLMRESNLDVDSAEYQRMKAAMQLAQMKLDNIAGGPAALIYPNSTSTRH